MNIISWKCPLCGEAFEDNETDFMEDAFREYRKRKGYLQPEEIKAFRKHLKLSQNEFGNLVGIGLASVNRYENGGLQSEAAEKALRFVMQKYSDQIIENPYSGITP